MKLTLFVWLLLLGRSVLGAARPAPQEDAGDPRFGRRSSCSSASGSSATSWCGRRWCPRTSFAWLGIVQFGIARGLPRRLRAGLPGLHARLPVAAPSRAGRSLDAMGPLGGCLGGASLGVVNASDLAVEPSSSRCGPAAARSRCTRRASATRVRAALRPSTSPRTPTSPISRSVVACCASARARACLRSTAPRFAAPGGAEAFVRGALRAHRRASRRVPCSSPGWRRSKRRSRAARLAARDAAVGAGVPRGLRAPAAGSAPVSHHAGFFSAPLARAANRGDS